ncbi:MAG: hypothetical protein HUJ51_05825 [Eggerthellaceae bacterium]|nr:hypothetical protein [Eggerthellaceae bacterium]
MQGWAKICQIRRVLNSGDLLVRSQSNIENIVEQEVFLAPPFLYARRSFKILKVESEAKAGEWKLHLDCEFAKDLKFELSGRFLLVRAGETSSQKAVAESTMYRFDTYVHDAEELLGFAVIDDAEGPLGKVVDFIEGSMQSRIVVKIDNNALCKKFRHEPGFRLNIPFVEEICYKRESQRRQIRTNVPEGLFKL